MVGDDDQSIYGWRGAEVSNILEFERHFPNPAVIKLEQNYRSTNAILHTANSLIKNNPRRRPKTLWSEHGTGEKSPRRARAHRPGGSRLRRRGDAPVSSRRAGSQSWDDFAILFRMNSQSKTFELAMRESGVPYRIVGGQSIFDKREVKDLLGYISAVCSTRTTTARLLRINQPSPARVGRHDHRTRARLFACEQDQFIRRDQRRDISCKPSARKARGAFRVPLPI